MDKAATLFYYGSLFWLCVVFAGLSGGQGREKEILLTAASIVTLCLAKSIFCTWRGRGRKGIRQERNILLTEKRGRGLMQPLLMIFFVLAASGSVYVSAAGEAREYRKTENMVLERMGKKELTAEEGIENKLWVEVRNERGQKLLIQYDAVYQMTESLKLELPLSNFEEGEVYQLRLECTNCQTDERSSRIFYLKGVEP